MSRNRLSWIGIGLVGIGLLVIISGDGLQAQDRGRPSFDPAGIRSLSEETGGTARIRIHPVTGSARFVQVPAGRLILAGQDPRERAGTFLRRHGRIFGIGDPATELRLHRSATDPQGFTHLNYLQEHQGVAVFGGLIRIHFDRPRTDGYCRRGPGTGRRRPRTRRSAC